MITLFKIAIIRAPPLQPWLIGNLCERGHRSTEVWVVPLGVDARNWYASRPWLEVPYSSPRGEVLDGLARQCAGTLWAMSVPIKILSDGFADYVLRIKCKKCGHERITDPHALAKLLGWETALPTVAYRLRCSKCNVREECELTAMNQTKPRDYRTEH